MNPRRAALENWLTQQCKLSNYQLEPLQNDASFRQYFRLRAHDHSYVVMDAPPERENCKSFVAIAKALRANHLSVPTIFAADIEKGFLLLTDFGDRLYLHELTAYNVELLYEEATSALSVLQTCREVEGWTMPLFTADFMYQELQLFKEWFLIKYLNLVLPSSMEVRLDSFFHMLATEAAGQPQVFMHRDYHSANLMVLPESQVGILDFQDAFIGPVTYDLVSLLRDCYIDWPKELIIKLVLQYKAKLSAMNAISEEQFIRWFDLMGVQRHLKTLLTFSRKFCRDSNPNYLKHIPRTINYIISVCAEYPECRDFMTFFTAQVRENVCAQ